MFIAVQKTPVGTYNMCLLKSNPQNTGQFIFKTYCSLQKHARTDYSVHILTCTTGIKQHKSNTNGSDECK